jgi:hypothetical protein
MCWMEPTQQSVWGTETGNQIPDRWNVKVRPIVILLCHNNYVIIIENCSLPFAAPNANGYITPYTSTLEGAIVTYVCWTIDHTLHQPMCKQSNRTAVCTADGNWEPNSDNICDNPIGILTILIVAWWLPLTAWCDNSHRYKWFESKWDDSGGLNNCFHGHFKYIFLYWLSLWSLLSKTKSCINSASTFRCRPSRKWSTAKKTRGETRTANKRGICLSTVTWYMYIHEYSTL